MDFVLGLDLGSQSIGWSVCPCSKEGEVSGLYSFDVRIFDDGRDAKSNEPLAVGRRLAKQTARRRQRAFGRRQALLKCLRKHDLLPNSTEENRTLVSKDPYRLRATAVEQKIDRHEIGRAILHINKRRGFKSTRKDYQAEDADLKGMKKGIEELKEELGDSMTLGQFLYAKKQKNDRAVLRFKSVTKGSTNEWSIYPERRMYEHEIGRIFEEQQKHYSDLDDTLLNRILFIVIEQRPLKKPKVGSCRFHVDQRRAPLALPSQQSFRIYQEVSNLEIRQNSEFRRLRDDERQAIVDQLTLKATKSYRNKNGVGPELTFAKIKTKILGDSSIRFNLEEMGRKSLSVDVTALELSSNACFGDRWFNIPLYEQDTIVLKLTGTEDKQIQDNDDAVIKWLMKTYSITGASATACLHAKLADGYGRLGLRALSEILPFLKGGMHYADSVQAAGLKDPLAEVELHEKLPYYGEVLENYTMPHPSDCSYGNTDNPEIRYGRIPNPTVHIGLNQIRKVVNALIERYGRPKVVRIELARDFAFSAKQNSEEKRQQEKNRKRNGEARDAIARAGHDPRNPKNLLRYKLWTELNKDCLQRSCPFSGRKISIEKLFSSEVEIEHIIPFSRSFDDSFNNKTLCFRDYNRLKSNLTPYEAFGQVPEYADILERVQSLNSAKRWRFREDAYERFMKENPDLIARTLNDTRYLSRAAVAYLRSVCSDVQTIRGAMTSSLRHFWGLDRILSDANEKDRSEHRHHAIDAFVVACSTPSFLRRFQFLTEANKRNFPDQNPLHLDDFPPPYKDYKPSQIADSASRILVSHRLNQIQESRGNIATSGQLHNETFYGLNETREKGFSLRVRKPLLALKQADCKNIASPRLRIFFSKKAEEISNASEWKKLLEGIVASGRIKRLRMLENKSSNAVTGFSARDGSIYRYAMTSGNAWADIISFKGSNENEVWKVHVASVFDAGSGGAQQPVWKVEHPTARKIARVSINDTIALRGESGKWFLYRVKKLNQDGRVYVRDIRVAQEDKDTLSIGLSASRMKEYSFTKVAIGVIGDLRAPKHIRENLYVGSIYRDPE